MSCTALSHVALLQPNSAQRIWGWRTQECVSHAAFSQQVQRWCARFARVPDDEIALYFEDTLAFAAALFGAWHAGKHVVLPGDAQPATLAHLLQDIAACAGDLPNALQPWSEGAGAELQPLSLANARLSMFTSGSSGQPVRIDKTLAQLDAEVQSLHALFGQVTSSHATPHVLATVSHQHIYGLLFRVLWPLAAGRSTSAHMLRYPEELQLQLQAQTACVLVSSPALLARLPTHLAWGQACHGLQGIFSSGGPLSVEASQLAQQLLGHSPAEVFGSSETGGIAWRMRSHHGEQWNLLPGVRSRINGEGVLEVASAHLPDAAQWWTTSDRAQLHATGAGFCLLGRADRIVKVAEKRVSLTLIEQVLAASPWVQMARAVMLPASGTSSAQRIGMVLELTDLGWEALQAQGRRNLGLTLQGLVAPHVERVVLPRSWRYVERMPMNAQGKSTQQQLVSLFRPVLPRLQWITRQELQAHGIWHVAPDLLVLEGHFPDAPLVPGVAQVHWVEWTARQAFAMPTHFVRAEVLKFQMPILPHAQVHVNLDWKPEKATLQFTLASGDATHASGRLVWSE